MTSSSTSTSERKGVESMIEKGIETVLKDEIHTVEASATAAEQQSSKSKAKGSKESWGWMLRLFDSPLIPLSISMLVGALVGGSVTHGVHILKARNGSAGTTATITSESIAIAPPTNPATITLEEGGGMIISGSVKLPADVEVKGGLVGITLVDGAVLDCNQHSITGDVTSESAGIKVEGDGAKVKITNCPSVTKLGIGAFLEGEGQDVVIENSSFDHNTVHGIYSENTGAGGGESSLVLNDVSASNNGIEYRPNYGTGMELGFWDTIKLNKIVANGNKEHGVSFEGQDVTIKNSSFDGNSLFGINANGRNGEGSLEVKDVSASNNGSIDYAGGAGIVVDDWDTVILNKVVATENAEYDNGEVGVGVNFTGRGTLILKGKNSIDNNQEYGLVIFGESSSSRATVLVDGKLTTNDNLYGSGILAQNTYFEIKKGSVEACGNNVQFTDIWSFGGTAFLGKKYICGTGAPVCKPCREGKSRTLGVGVGN